MSKYIIWKFITTTFILMIYIFYGGIKIVYQQMKFSTFFLIVAVTLLSAFNVSAQVIQGVSSSETPYIVPVAPGVQTWSILTVGDDVGGYRLVGIPDGTGAYNNGDGTFTWLVNHELRSTQGVPRAHSTTEGGAFVSKWIVNGLTGNSQTMLEVQSGEDLIQLTAFWNSDTNTYNEPAKGAVFNRFCSSDLPAMDAFYNHETGNGYAGRIYMNGEETSEGRAFAHIVDGASAGVTYELPYFGKSAWENVVVHPNTGDQTLVIGIDDSSPGQIYVYIGTKTDEGNDAEKAGLVHGQLYGVVVDGNPAEEREPGILTGTRFSLHHFENVAAMSGAELESVSDDAQVTRWLRPEDGVWDPNNHSDFYFVTTDRFDQTQDGLGDTIGRSRLYRLRFDNVMNPLQGGIVYQMSDGTMGVMFDNMTMDNYGNILIQEDPGGSPRTAKIWQYSTRNSTLKIIAEHDPARFGSLNSDAVEPFTTNEESSGIIDATEVLGAGWFLLNVQAHYSHEDPELVQGGQLVALFNPDSAAEGVVAEHSDYVFFKELNAGLNMVSLPLQPVVPYTARSLMDEIGASVVIKLDESSNHFVGFTAMNDGDGFAIEGGSGYIVNVSEAKVVSFVGGAWQNSVPIHSAPSVLNSKDAWAFILSADVSSLDIGKITVQNSRIGDVQTMTATDSHGNMQAVWADLNRQSVAAVGDVLEIHVFSDVGQLVGVLHHEVTPQDINRAFTHLNLDIETMKPTRTALFTNYPNPFNPETWMPYQLGEGTNVVFRIYNSSGHLVRNLDLGFKNSGFYLNRDKAAYWDGRNNAGEKMASGVYFYQLNAGKYTSTRRLVIVK